VPAAPLLPENYREQASIDLSKSKILIVGAIALGLVLLIAVAWLLVQFTQLLRPAALEYLGFRKILTITPDGQFFVELPLGGAVVAFVLVMLTHELVHGLSFWWFAGQRPSFGVKWLFVYATASPETYFSRNQYLVVGAAPFVLLTLLGLLLMLIVPAAAVTVLSFFIVFNAAGSGGDLLMIVRLLSYSSDALMRDSDTGVVVYGRESSRSGSPSNI